MANGIRPPMVSIKDVVRSSVKVPEFDKHLKKAGGTYRPKRCGNNNKDIDNSPKALNDKNSVFLFKTLLSYKQNT